jgi:hypothetical protein
LLECADILADFFNGERHDAVIKQKLSGLREMLKRERNPLAIITELQRIAQDCESKYPRLPGALLFLRKEGESHGLGDWLRRLLA